MNDQLKTLQERLRRAVAAGELALWDLRPALETVQYSPAWKRRLGFPEPEGADSTHFWRCRVHPVDLAPMLAAMQAHSDGGQPSYEIRFRLRSNGSGYRLMHSRGRVIERDAEGRVLRMVGSMLDLTERPCTPQVGLPDGAQGSHGEPAGVPLQQPLHALLDAPGAELERVLGQVQDLLLASLDDLARR